MKRNKTTLKSYFQTGDVPTQSQYENLIDSLVHVDDVITLINLDGNIALKDQSNLFSSEQSFTGIYVGSSATFDDQVSFNSDVEFTSPTTFGHEAEFQDGFVSNNGITINGTSHFSGVSTFNNSALFNNDITTSSLTVAQGGIHITGESVFDDRLEANGLIDATNGVQIQFPWTALNVASQATGSILIENNASGAAAPTIAGKTDNNSPGLQFIASTRDTSGTLADMIFNVRENNNTDFTLELNTIGFQFRRFLTPLVNIYRNGKQENLFGLDVHGLLDAQGGADISSDGTDGDEVLRLSLDGGRDWAFKQKGSGAGTCLELRSTQNKDYYHYSTASFFRNSVDDSSHLTLNHSAKTADLTGNLDVSGTISGSYKSSDGTAGYTGTFTAGAYSITVKDGIITDAVNIS